MKVLRWLFPIIVGVVLSVGLVLVIDAAAQGPRQPQAWTGKTPIPQEVVFYGHAQCPGNPDNIYILGGLINDRPAPWVSTDQFWRYDAAADTWNSLAPLPPGLGAVAASCYDGYIYAAGGRAEGGASTLFYRYDIGADAWDQRANLPRSLLAGTLAAWNGHVYLVGGAADDYPFSSRTTQVDRYDVDADTWQANWGTPMPAWAYASSAQAGPNLYLIGGYAPTIGNSTNSLRYDLDRDVWSFGPTFSSARAANGLAVTEQYLYAIGGDLPGGNLRNETDLVQRLDHTLWPNGTWETVDALPSALVGNHAGACSEAVSGGEVWSIGGEFDTGLVVTDAVWYQPAQPCFKLQSPIVVELQPAPNSFNAPVTTAVSAQYDQWIRPSSGNYRTFAVHAMQTGWISETIEVVSDTIVLSPLTPFFPGELVQATATTATLSTGGMAPIASTVWQFMAGVDGGSGHFTDGGQRLDNSASFFTALGDLDGDGDLDAFVPNGGGSLGAEPNKVWLNNGSGSFTDSGQNLGSGRSVGLALGDVDGDGDLDAFVAEGGFNPEPNTVWLNDGSGTFTDSGQLLGNGNGIMCALGDLDGDGDLDAVVTNLNESGGEPDEVWLNDGSGTFSLGQLLGTGMSGGVSLGDIDGDGDLDVLVTGYDQTIWLNNGSGTFIDNGHNAVPGTHGILADLDSDGDLDAFAIQGRPAGPNQVWFNEDALDGVTISGPQAGQVDEFHTFTTSATPTTTLTPITYTWQASDQMPVTHTGGLSDVLALAWSMPGAKSITVTVASPLGTATAVHTIRIDDEPVGGLIAGNDSPTSLGQPTLFSAGIVSGTNVVFAWDFGDGVTGTGQIVSHTYAMTGTYTATVTASNSAGSAMATTVVTVVDRVVRPYRLYLPVAVKP